MVVEKRVLVDTGEDVDVGTSTNSSSETFLFLWSNTTGETFAEVLDLR